MTHIKSFLLFWILSGAALNAAEIPVRSGAHDGFARLVLDVTPGTSWTLEENEAGLRISISGHDDGFDVARVFERIQQNYIGSVTGDARTLDVAYNCACKSTVFRSGTDMIVIDVSPRDIEGETPPTDAGPFGLQFVGRTQLSFEPLNAEPPAAAPKKTPVLADGLKKEEQEPAPPIRATNASRTADLDSLKQAQEKLSERIGLAATTGILRASNQSINLLGSEPRPQIDTRIFDSSLTSPAEPETVGPIGGNLRVTSSSDLPSSGLDQIQDSTTLGVRCIEPGLVDVQNWGSTSDFAGAVSALRRDLFSEFDSLNTDAATRLARLYLHYGFGAEAKQILSMSGDLDPEYLPLIAVADVMEYGVAPSGNYLENFVDCDSDVALWAILATRHLEPSDTINSKAALRTLSALPLHLRSFLAPALSKKLLAYGDQVSATAALRSVERTAEPLSSAGRLAKAEIELSNGNAETAQERLKDVVESNDQQSAEALIRYVDTHLDAEVAIDDDIATLVEAYAIEFRDHPLGDELRRSHVLALAKSNQFDAAFSALEQIRPSDEAGLADALVSPLIELLSKTADDATFLEHAFAVMTDRPEDLSLHAKVLQGERLADLGFFGEAEQLIATADGMPHTPQNRLLRARVSVGLSRPREALAILGDLDGEAADKLRAEAAALAGEFDIASDLFANIDATSDEVRSAWLSDNWQGLVERTEPILGPVLEVAGAEMENSTELSGMLGRTEDALEESARARGVIQQLLQTDVLAERPNNQ